MHSILREDIYHSDTVYININLDNYIVRFIKSNAFNNNNYGSQQQSQVFYPNICNFYANGDDTYSHKLSFILNSVNNLKQKNRVIKKEQEYRWYYFSKYFQ